MYRRTPEELLREVQAEEEAARHGQLKIFLGYASGVGKTVRMLAEAVRRRKRGEDVVVGAMQRQAPPEAKPLLAKLETIPPKTTGQEMAIDVEALIRRHPAVCIIDGLAYDNPPGSRNASRWQDVEALINSGIRVVGSINIQYINELRHAVESITGKHVTQTVPLSFIKSAEEIEIVDAPPEEPTDRGGCGLSRLREMALVLAAEVVDHQLASYLERHGIRQQFGTHERILVCITPRANVEEMIDAARIVAERFHGELIAAYVKQPYITADDQAILDRKLAVARAAGANVQILDGEDAVETLVEFARSRGVTQLFIGHTQRTGLWPRLLGTPVDRLIRLSRGIDVRLFPQ